MKLVRRVGDAPAVLVAVENPQVRAGEDPNRAPYRPNRKLDPSEIEDLVRRYEAGETTFALAAQFGIHRQTVSRNLAKAGIPTRSRSKLTPEIVAELVWQYEQGASTVQLGRKYELAASSVGKALKKAGVTLRPPKFDRWHQVEQGDT